MIVMMIGKSDGYVHGTASWDFLNTPLTANKSHGNRFWMCFSGDFYLVLFLIGKPDIWIKRWSSEIFCVDQRCPPLHLDAAKKPGTAKHHEINQSINNQRTLFPPLGFRCSNQCLALQDTISLLEPLCSELEVQWRNLSRRKRRHLDLYLSCIVQVNHTTTDHNTHRPLNHRSRRKRRHLDLYLSCIVQVTHTTTDYNTHRPRNHSRPRVPPITHTPTRSWPTDQRTHKLTDQPISVPLASSR